MNYHEWAEEEAREVHFGLDALQFEMLEEWNHWQREQERTRAVASYLKEVAVPKRRMLAPVFGWRDGRFEVLGMGEVLR